MYVSNSSLGGLKFGKDGDGNVGYYGADGSLIPFKSGEVTLVFEKFTSGSLTMSAVAPRNYTCWVYTQNMDLLDNGKFIEGDISYEPHFVDGKKGDVITRATKSSYNRWQRLYII